MYLIKVSSALIVHFVTQGNLWESNILCKFGIDEKSKLIRINFEMINSDFAEFYFLEPDECLEHPFILKEITPAYELSR